MEKTGVDSNMGIFIRTIYYKNMRVSVFAPFF